MDVGRHKLEGHTRRELDASCTAKEAQCSCVDQDHTGGVGDGYGRVTQGAGYTRQRDGAEENPTRQFTGPRTNVCQIRADGGVDLPGRLEATEPQVWGDET